MASNADLAGCGKTISAQQNFDGLHVWDKWRTPRRHHYVGQIYDPARAAGTAAGSATHVVVLGLGRE